MDALTRHVILLFTIISITSTSVVKWLPNSSFNLPNNFKDGKLPCSKKTVVFPKSMSGSVGIESILDIGALILPDDGEIILQNAVIALGQEIGDSNCTDGNSYYLDKSISSWVQADVWSSDRFTEATPDTEKVPCYDDVVIFPSNSKYTVRLPDQTQYVRSLIIGNESQSTQTFQHYIQVQSDQMGQFVLNDYFTTGVNVKADTSCQQRFGCPCQKNPPEIDCSVKYCAKPTCIAPVKPIGYCCSFCGGYVSFKIAEGFDMISFKELVEKTVDGYDNGVVYHIGFTSFTPDPKIQVVIMDKGEYIGNSAEAINSINNNVFRHWYKGEKLTELSGAPLSREGLSVKIFVSMFFVVVLVFGSIYLYYYRLPQLTFPVGVGARSRSSGMFSRFQNRSDSVVSLTRRDSGMAYTPRAAFRNPLYDSKRGRVQVAEALAEEISE